MRWVGLVALLLATQALAECDCMWYAYTALKMIGVRLKTIPAVVISAEHGGRGFYVRGVVGVPNNQVCKIMVHEFVHQYQYEHYGEQKMYSAGWWLNEQEAEAKSVRAMNIAGDCR